MSTQTPTPTGVSIKANLQAVRSRIQVVCQRTSRDPSAVSLVIVTKYSSPEAIAEVLKLEHPVILGESKVQEVIRKLPILLEGLELSKQTPSELPPEPSHSSDSRSSATEEAHNATSSPLVAKPPLNGAFYLHFIGHLQTNKVKMLLPHMDALQSLDRLSLAKALEQTLAKTGRILPCFIQLNLQTDSERFGFTPETIREALPVLAEMKHLSFVGLMTMAPPELTISPETADSGEKVIRQCFQSLKAMKLELSEEALTQGFTNFPLSELSMGMSQDYEIALEEGASCIRLGSTIFK